MKIENFNKVKSLIEAMNNIDHTLKKVDKLLSSYEEDKERYSMTPEVPGVLDGGYSFFVSKESDRSGFPIDMSGCYVGIEATQAIKKVLEDKKILIMKTLQEYGVELSNLEQS